MKHMRTLKTIGWVAMITVLFDACKNEALYPIPEPEWAPVAEVQWTDQNKTFFDYENLAEAAFEFTLVGEDFGYEEARVASIDVFTSYNGSESVLLGNYNSLPATVSLSASQAASLFGVSAADLALGDTFTFSFVVYGQDGRVFRIYNNNICNLIRIAGICSIDAYVLNPTVALTSVSEENNAFDMSELASSSDDSFVFTMDKRDYTSLASSSAEVQLLYNNGTDTAAWKTLTSVTTFPSEVAVTASQAASLFGMTTAQLSAGDQFDVRIVFSNPVGNFTNYGSKVCGMDFPSNIVYPQHSNATGDISSLSWVNPYGATTAPEPTPLTGTCSLTIAVTDQ